MGRRKDRSERDRAGVGPEPDVSRQLIPLDKLDGFDFADGEPDIRGWDVVTLNGRELGEVEDVLVDPNRREVVMLDVELREGGVHAEVPIRAVQLDRDRKIVVLDSGDLDRGVRRDDRARDQRVDEEQPEPRRTYQGSGRRAFAAKADARPAEQANATDKDEVVLERRPVIEEVVVRRRPVDEE
jgi:sporulation protein YlmC with PRC-barrel domain